MLELLGQEFQRLKIRRGKMLFSQFINTYNTEYTSADDKKQRRDKSLS